MSLGLVFWGDVFHPTVFQHLLTPPWFLNIIEKTEMLS